MKGRHEKTNRFDFTLRGGICITTPTGGSGENAVFFC